MTDTETRHERFLKKAQMWLAVLVGLVTFIVGAYNAKNMFFSKKGPGELVLEVGSESGQAMPSTSIEIMKTQGGVVATSTTGSDGRFRQKLEPGNYTLKLARANYQGETMFFSVDPGQTTSLNVKLKASTRSLRTAVEEVGASWIKEIGAPKKPAQ
jgi:hypothetical protein